MHGGFAIRRFVGSGVLVEGQEKRSKVGFNWRANDISFALPWCGLPSGRRIEKVHLK